MRLEGFHIWIPLDFFCNFNSFINTKCGMVEQKGCRRHRIFICGCLRANQIALCVVFVVNSMNGVLLIQCTQVYYNPLNDGLISRHEWHSDQFIQDWKNVIDNLGAHFPFLLPFQWTHFINSDCHIVAYQSKVSRSIFHKTERILIDTFSLWSSIVPHIINAFFNSQKPFGITTLFISLEHE